MMTSLGKQGKDAIKKAVRELEYMEAERVQQLAAEGAFKADQRDRQAAVRGRGVPDLVSKNKGIKCAI